MSAYPCRAIFDTEHALQDLIKNQNLYAAGSPCTCVPIQLDRLRIAKGETRPKSLLKLLRAEARRYADNFEQLVVKPERERERDEANHFKAYSDPLLRARPAVVKKADQCP